MTRTVPRGGQRQLSFKEEAGFSTAVHADSPALKARAYATAIRDLDSSEVPRFRSSIVAICHSPSFRPRSHLFLSSGAIAATGVPSLLSLQVQAVKSWGSFGWQEQ